MTFLGGKPETIVIGQACAYPGTAMTATLSGFPKDKILEMPVAEDFQQGIANGLAIAGRIPISIYPRWDFFVLAANQLINHTDRFIEISDYRPKIIIRVGIGSIRPLHPSFQHCNDYTGGFQKILRNIEVIRLEEPEQIFDAYVKAYERIDNKSTILVEIADHYNDK